MTKLYIYIYIKGTPVELEPDRPQHDAPKPVLSPSSILPPLSSHCTFITEIKIRQSLKHIVIAIFFFLKLSQSEVALFESA